MRILVHDFAGHPFQVQLSRALARRGHDVCHAYCASLTTTPRGALSRRPDDPEGFEIEAISLGEPLRKYAFLKRRAQERRYGRLLAACAQRFEPQVVLSGNAPLDAQAALLRWSRAHGARFVYWVQDLLGIATYRLLRRKVPLLGHLVGGYYLQLERRLLRASDRVVLITEDFRPILSRTGVPEERLRVIPNWAPLDEVPLRPRDNPWAVRHGLTGRPVLLYSGTLGMKHNPELLRRLAAELPEPARVVVISEGMGADWLKARRAEQRLDRLTLLGFQPFEEMPDVLASADVLIAILEPDAGVFSVPSKVLTYLCAARPVLLAVPPENLAARIVATQQAGTVVPPSDADGFVAAAVRLLGDAPLRERLGGNARRYAETHFDLERIADRFEEALAPSTPG